MEFREAGRLVLSGALLVLSALCGWLLGVLMEDPGELVVAAVVGAAIVIALVALLAALGMKRHRLFGPKMGKELVLIEHGGLPPDESGMPGWYVFARASHNCSEHLRIFADTTVRAAYAGRSHHSIGRSEDFASPQGFPRTNQAIVKFSSFIMNGSDLSIEIYSLDDVRITKIEVFDPRAASTRRRRPKARPGGESPIPPMPVE